MIQSAAIIDGIHTEFVISIFDDRVFVLVTQMKKMGTLVSVEAEGAGAGALGLGGGSGYSVSVLLGRRDDPLLAVYARQVMERVCSSLQRPLLLGIALKPEGRGTSTFEAIINELISMKRW
eukprot:CAMPEP_0194569516 /NCGR_PEP_ID=MMETSP0292-20121207/7195_1 /TAXON_ID=39354 /ORGANISM="Heterosigma akashiwo, Strain CCMP2393" /LENGTH=120 /DNA_ID=CAMNT_0039419771 /DNA_START=103 /DNA_END=465 /DNA_ORIENTATION=+